MSYQARRLARVNAENEKRTAARLMPPPEPAPDLPRQTFEERRAARKSQEEGKQIAAEEAAKARINAGPVNPFRKRAEELRTQLYRPGARMRFDHYTALADQYDAKEEQAKLVAEHDAAVAADPMVATARSYAQALTITAPTDEFKQEANVILGIAMEGNSQTAWQRMKALEERIWQHQDRIAAEKLASKVAADHDFQQVAALAEQSRERFDHAATMVPDEVV